MNRSQENLRLRTRQFAALRTEASELMAIFVTMSKRSKQVAAI